MERRQLFSPSQVAAARGKGGTAARHGCLEHPAAGRRLPCHLCRATSPAGRSHTPAGAAAYKFPAPPAACPQVSVSRRSPPPVRSHSSPEIHLLDPPQQKTLDSWWCSLSRLNVRTHGRCVRASLFLGARLANTFRLSPPISGRNQHVRIPVGHLLLGKLIEDAPGRHINGVAVIARPQTACASQLARRAANTATPPAGGYSARSRVPSPPRSRSPDRAKPARSMPAGPHRSSVFPFPSVAGGHRHRGSVCRPDRAPSRRPLPGLLPPSLARAGNSARQRYDRVVLVAARRSSSLHANKGALSARKGDGPCPERNRTAEPGPRARAGQVFGGVAVPVMSAGPPQIRSDPRLLDIFRIGHRLLASHEWAAPSRGH